MRALLRDPGGPVDELVQRIGRRTRGEALQASRGRFDRRTGDYENRMQPAERFEHPAGPGSRVVNTSDHALILELGSRPHVITPRRPGYPLRFVVAGRTVRTYRVNHPGTPAYRPMSDGLSRAVAAET